MKKKIDTPSGEVRIDMPEVKDIPGQEYVKPAFMNGMIDETPSSADEEAEGIPDERNDDDDTLMDDRSNVSKTEKELLRRSARPLNDEDEDLASTELDETDNDGDPLAESSNPADMGADLDVPGTELDDLDEELGEEDEENNTYSGQD